jgi:hypothetical protein
MRAVLALLLALAAPSAAAQDVDLLKGSAVRPPGSPPVPAAPGRDIALTPETCAALARLAGSGAGAGYQPGVDATGRAVAPADLPGAPRPRIDDFPIEITAPVNGGQAAGTQPLLRLGFVTIRNNRAYFNGQPLADPDLDQLVAACRERR